MLAILNSCSLSRRAANSTVSDDITGSLINGRFLSSNIAEKGFFIRKAEVSAGFGNEEYKLVINLRKSPDNRYLLSIRNRTGIEIARIYADSDTLLVNDRLNKVLMTGDAGVIEKKLGIDFRLIPVILGDIIAPREVKDSLICDGESGSIQYSDRGLTYLYTVKCSLRKPVAFDVKDRNEKLLSHIEYSDFNTRNKLKYPAKINIKGRNTDEYLSVSIKDIEFPWIGEIEFVPGDRYEIIRLK